MILDLHVHSKYSFDSLSEPASIIRTAKRKGLDGVAITDHNTIKGAVEAARINSDGDFMIVVGSEVATEAGDIIGLFLTEEIRSRESSQVIEEIHRQGGVAVLAHPYKGHRLNDQITEQVDVIEAFNSRVGREDNRRALMLAQKHKKRMIAGSDAHFCSEIGAGRVIITSTDAKVGILNGELELRKKETPLYLEALSQIIKCLKLGKYQRLPRQLGGLVLSMRRREG